MSKTVSGEYELTVRVTISTEVETWAEDDRAFAILDDSFDADDLAREAAEQIRNGNYEIDQLSGEIEA